MKIQAFNTLKSKLTSYPVLQLYNPHLDTELHTDASSLAIAGFYYRNKKMVNDLQ